jgi:hypothetical protein
MSWSDISPRYNLGIAGYAVSTALLCLPTLVLGALGNRLAALPLLVGAGVQCLFVLVFIRAHPGLATAGERVGHRPVPDRPGMGLGSHPRTGRLGGSLSAREFSSLVRSGWSRLHDLTRTGAEPLRRANKWSRRIACRTHWPLQLADCRTVPEVEALRDAVRDEAGPALALLSDPRPEVQVAALGSLEYRPDWKPGEAELVLKVARGAIEPAVRAAGAYALAGVWTAHLIEGLGSFLRDPSPEVRHAAAEAILWEGDGRWPFAREAVREALSDPKLAHEGGAVPRNNPPPSGGRCRPDHLGRRTPTPWQSGRPSPWSNSTIAGSWMRIGQNW